MNNLETTAGSSMYNSLQCVGGYQCPICGTWVYGDAIATHWCGNSGSAPWWNQQVIATPASKTKVSVTREKIIINDLIEIHMSTADLQVDVDGNKVVIKKAINPQK